MANGKTPNSVDEPSTTTTLGFVLSPCRNPRTGEGDIHYPRLTGLSVLTTEEIVQEAVLMKKTEETYPVALGVVNGFLSTAKYLHRKKGHTVLLGDLVRLHLVLNGTVPAGATAVTSANALYSVACALDALQPDRSDFSFSYQGSAEQWVELGKYATYFGAMVAPGTELTFTVKSRGGDDDNPLTVATATARLVAAVA